MPPPIVILGYSEAAMFVNRDPSPQIGAIISIHGRREHGIELAIPHRLDLIFDDVDAVDISDLQALQATMRRQRWSRQTGQIEAGPSSEDAASIIEFARSIVDIKDLILCHCGGGMSRAPAAGLICLAVWNGPGSEVDCVRQIRELRQGAVPHLGLIRFADMLLGREGNLIAAIKASK